MVKSSKRKDEKWPMDADARLAVRVALILALAAAILLLRVVGVDVSLGELEQVLEELARSSW